jgi:membrane-bound ClpP family serine protease
MNKTLDKVSEYLAPRKGLLPLIGIILIIVNFVCQFFPLGWLKDSNLFLHLGAVIAIFGLMLAWAL